MHSVVGVVYKGLGDVTLQEEVHHWVWALRFKKISKHSQFVLTAPCLVLADKDLIYHLLIHLTCPPAAVHPAVIMMNLSSETENPH